MVIEDSQEQEVWKNNARFWYCKAANNESHVGRLYHHLAIIAPGLERMFYYCKSLGVTQPFASSRESILTAFDSIANADISTKRGQCVNASFIYLHSITFTQIGFEHFDVALDGSLDTLNKIIGPLLRWKVKA